MFTRRKVLALGAGTLAASRILPAHADEGPVLGDDGLYHQSWFLDSFLDLKDDLSDAANKKKRFAIFWELKGCPYCKETHFVNFARPDIQKFIREKFEILQLDMVGSRTVTDFDGDELSERKLAKKYGVRFSPTILFFETDAAKIAKLEPRKRLVAKLQGYLQPDHFLSMFKYVESGAYETKSFRKYLKGLKAS